MGKDKNVSAESEQKPINKMAKFMWFGISAVVLAAGIFMVKKGVPFDNTIVKIIFAAAVLVPLLLCAQRISCERFKEDGSKNIIAVIFYYLCIFIFVPLLPFLIWIDKFLA